MRVYRSQLFHVHALGPVLAEVTGGTPSTVYAESRVYVAWYAPENITVRPFHEAGLCEPEREGPIHYILRWRRTGFSKSFRELSQRAEAPWILARSRLVRIVGKARLDLRDNLLFLLQRDDRDPPDCPAQAEL